MAVYRYLLLTTSVGDIEKYGIAAVAEEENESRTIIDSVKDMGMDRVAINAFVQRCNHLQLSPCHLMDVIDDFLAEI